MRLASTTQPDSEFLAAGGARRYTAQMSYELVTLALLNLRGVGPGTARVLWRKHPSMSTRHDVVTALREHKKGHYGEMRNELAEAFDDAQCLLDRCDREGIHVLGPHHPNFPPRFRKLPDGPLLLFVLGNSDCLLRDSVAIIGTREPTDFGTRAARKIAKSLAEAGWVIVSGLAEGCDTAGHEGCLDGCGQTVAFLAHGFGRIYPASNKNLAERIVEKGGCLATEYPPGQPPTRGSFVERDRLQSGLSLGVIVIETDVKGGTMHTVRHATEQHRPLAALSHTSKWLKEPKVQGNLLLIAEGRATPLKEKNDVFQFVNSLRQPHLTDGVLGVCKASTGSQGEFKMV
jgi:DNA processing protein